MVQAIINEEMIVDLFERTRALRKSGRQKWNIDDVCRWSFFFIDKSRDKLLRVADKLKAIGYEVVGFLAPDPEDDDEEILTLRVDRIEKHSVASLLARNIELDDLVNRFEIKAYDGMDIGAINGP